MNIYYASGLVAPLTCCLRCLAQNYHGPSNGVWWLQHLSPHPPSHPPNEYRKSGNIRNFPCHDLTAKVINTKANYCLIA